MDPSALLPLLAALVGAVFAALVWRSFVTGGRRAHQLLWALGLSAYAVASLADAYVAWRDWTPALYVAYLAFASGNVGLLGAGTMLLLRSRMRRVGVVFAVAAALGILVVILGASLATIDAAALARAGPAAGLAPLARDAPGSAARLAFILESAVGGLALIGGALWSWWENRRAGVLLIGVGALLVALGGTVEGLVTRYASDAGSAALAARLATQLLGIIVMFAGYLRGRDAAARSRRRADDVATEA